MALRRANARKPLWLRSVYHQVSVSGEGRSAVVAAVGGAATQLSEINRVVVFGVCDDFSSGAVDDVALAGPVRGEVDQVACSLQLLGGDEGLLYVAFEDFWQALAEAAFAGGGD
jgi:hypothetical protein